MVIAQSKTKIDKAMKSFKTWTKFVNPNYHEILKVEHTGIVDFTESTLKTLILPVGNTEKLQTIEFVDDFEDARTDDELVSEVDAPEDDAQKPKKKSFVTSDEDSEVENDENVNLEGRVSGELEQHSDKEPENTENQSASEENVAEMPEQIPENFPD